VDIPYGCENHPAMADTRHEILGVVELLVDSWRWAAGTVGTVVEADDQVALVEISDDRGHALDFISVPHRALVSSPGRTMQRFAS
jgi:hypothetical protein